MVGLITSSQGLTLEGPLQYNKRAIFEVEDSFSIDYYYVQIFRVPEILRSEALCLKYLAQFVVQCCPIGILLLVYSTLIIRSRTNLAYLNGAVFSPSDNCGCWTGGVRDLVTARSWKLI